MTCKVDGRNCDSDNPFCNIYELFCSQSMHLEKLTEQIASLIKEYEKLTEEIATLTILTIIFTSCFAANQCIWKELTERIASMYKDGGGGEDKIGSISA